MSRITRNLFASLRRLDARNPHLLPKLADWATCIAAGFIFAYVIFAYLVPK